MGPAVVTPTGNANGRLSTREGDVATKDRWMNKDKVTRKCSQADQKLESDLHFASLTLDQRTMLLDLTGAVTTR